MKWTRWSVAASAVAVGMGSAMLVGIGPGGAADAGRSLSDSFDNPRVNPYFPLRPGLVLRYRGTDGPATFHERIAITHRTKMIDGVKAVVSRDVLRRSDGTVAEATHDWYADDNQGNVWYLGEATATYDRHGHVRSRAGSWRAGADGAKAGLIMPHAPKPTDAYRQEYWRKNAEDQAWIVQNRATVTVPEGTHRDVVRSYEWSRLEQVNVSVKFYARGLGVIAEHDVAGGTEDFALVSVTRT